MFEGAAAETQTQSGTRRRGSVVRGGRCRATVPCIAQQNVTLQTSASRLQLSAAEMGITGCRVGSFNFSSSNNTEIPQAPPLQPKIGPKMVTVT